MTKKNNGEITPDNFLDAYKPVSPQRKGDRGTSEEKAELTTVEKAQSNEREAESIVLQSRNNDVEMTPLAYQEIFLRPNLGESMRYGKTYYVSRDDCKKVKALVRCFGEGYDRFPLSVFIHNLLEYHFAQFSGLINGIMSRQSTPNPFNKSNE